MKKRLRKKLGKKEFLKHGFPVSLILTVSKTDNQALDDFWEKLVATIKPKGLLMIGFVDTFFVFTDYAALPQQAATYKDRAWMRDWLDQQPEVGGYWVGPATATWHPSSGPF